MSTQHKKRRAFTLIELLVVIAVIAIMMGLFLSAVQKIREAANRMRCRSNLKQIGLAIHHFHDNEGVLPYSYWGTQNGVSYGGGPNSYAWSFFANLLPYLEQDNLHTKAGIPKQRLFATDSASATIKTFLCPSDASATATPRYDAGNLDGYAVGRSSYKGVSGSNWGEDYDQFQVGPGAFPTYWRNRGVNNYFDGLNYADGLFYRWNKIRPVSIAQITDGSSNTLMIGEDVNELNLYLSWPYANNVHGTCAIPPNALDPGTMQPFPAWNWMNNSGFRSRHSQGVHFALGDGSVQFIKNSILLSTYRALSTYAGGEVATLD